MGVLLYAPTVPALYNAIMNGDQPNISPQPEIPGQAPQKKDKTLLYVLLAGGGCLALFAIIAVVVFIVLFKVTSGPMEVVNLHLSALRNGDIEKAYSHCSGAFRQNTNLEAFKSFVNDNPLLMKASEFTSSNRKISNGVAELTGTVKGTDGSSQPAEFHLVQETQVWKIQYIYLSPAGVESEAAPE